MLVIGHQLAIAERLRRRLMEEGHCVSTVADGLDGQARVLGGGVDLVILDRVPRCDGLAVLDVIHRADPGLPVMVISSYADVQDRVACLERGAIDAVLRPFSLEELVVRVRTHLRTFRKGRPTSMLRVGELELDRLTRKARRGGVAIRLSTREFDLLVHFMRHPGQTLSRARLRSAVWGEDCANRSNVIDVYLGYLRRKLGRPHPIETVRSQGYRLIDPRVKG
ncbi:MAG: DNA-binding response regulator [Solirubrobacterales bacterium]|nr:MAG: DNA-binding response regulator [Solirubrobacterales bacterium]